MKKIILLLSILFNISFNIFSADYTLNELETLYKYKALTQEEYNILKKELVGSSEIKTGYYNLKINGREVSNLYFVAIEKNNFYFDLEEFFKLLDFKNYEKTKDGYKIYLGDNLDEVLISIANNKISKNGKYFTLKENWYLNEEGKFFLEKSIFQELFLSYCSIDANTLQVSMDVSFLTPEEITKVLDITIDKLKNKNKQNDIIYRDKKYLFDLGYLRLEVGENFNKKEKEKKYDNSWDGSLEYQGGLLYGELFFNYNIKEKQIDDIKLEYSDIWNNHTFGIDNKINGKYREWGLRFYKDEEFINDGTKILIRENVPIGSRVELIYMNTPIAVEDEHNGKVVFSNDMIISDRTYKLKIYTPDGKIIIKEITTVEDYDRQNKNEIKYDLNLNEQKEYKKYVLNSKVYYGITESFTLGGGYNRDIDETINNKYKYFDSTCLDLIYGSVYNGYSYIIKASGEKTWNSYINFQDKSLNNRYKYELLGDIRVGKYKYKYSQVNYGKYYDEKQKDNFEFQYNLTDNFRFTYDYENLKKYIEENEKSSKLGLNYDFNYNRILIGSSIKLDLNDSSKDEYSINTYYNGWDQATVRLENKWDNSGRDFESALSLYNNNFRGLFDFTAELKYSKERKEMLTFKLSLDISDWLTFDSFIGKNGEQNFRVGIDKVVDLKNPKVSLTSMDVSRVNVITFIDSNNNNIFDKDELPIDGVEVTIANQKVITDKSGKGSFYGISNGILYNLKPKIKKPSFTLGNNKIKVLSTVSSTVEAYIPIKPMINIHGIIELDKILKLNDREKEEFYSNILIEIKDDKGESIELVAPDNTGIFDISGLFPNSYILEVSYLGTKYDISSLTKKMKLDYKYNDSILGFEHQITFNVSNHNIKMINHL